ncbi:PREDICTED: putative ferric-chelate reductase 1 [Nanorana parkeri]|uniref:putative ferric-chelate reductase 1 n=1 Tax=Nanorana parkeri TaxID=125878 RepID=UPI000854CCA7|nr:PREDICTED: putative ferric-chelate reductase 1 [Nanorana parkeri]
MTARRDIIAHARDVPTHVYDDIIAHARSSCCRLPVAILVMDANSMQMDISASAHSIIILLILCLYGSINAYPDGQVQESCSSMVPNHGASAQTSNAPYSLTVSKTTYSAGEQISVTLSGNSKFEGFLIQARSGSLETPLGSFQLIDSSAQTLTCSTAASAVSQTSKASKSNVQVKWLAPSSGNSDIKIRATVVQSEKVFWTNVASCTITYNSTSASVSGTSCTNTANPSFRISASFQFVMILIVAIMSL